MNETVKRALAIFRALSPENQDFVIAAARSMLKYQQVEQGEEAERHD